MIEASDRLDATIAYFVAFLARLCMPAVADDEGYVRNTLANAAGMHARIPTGRVLAR